MSEDRFHRDDPQRTDPIRNFSTTLRGDGGSGAAPGPTAPPSWLGQDPAAAGSPGSTAGSPGSPAGGTGAPRGSDFVLHGIRVGNAVLQDQMQRGQSFAEQLAAGLAPPTADLRQVLERMLKSYSGMFVDSTLLWMDLLTPMRVPTVNPADPAGGAGPSPFPFPFPGTNPNLRAVVENMLRSYSNMYVDSMLLWLDLLSPRPPQPPQPPDPPDPNTLRPQPSPIPVTVFSARPTQVNLSLNPGAETQPLEACQVWSRDTTKPPLLDVSFQNGADGKPFLRVRVPDEQPADVYFGVVCNRTTGEPLGNLRVEIRQP
jgi:hypothetical protein